MPRKVIMRYIDRSNVVDTARGTIDREKMQVVNRHGVWCPLDWHKPHRRDLYDATWGGGSFQTSLFTHYDVAPCGGRVFRPHSQIIREIDYRDLVNGYKAGVGMIADGDVFEFSRERCVRAKHVQDTAQRLLILMTLPESMQNALASGGTRRIVELPYDWNDHLDAMCIDVGGVTRGALMGIYQSGVEHMSDWRMVHNARRVEAAR